MKSEKRIQKLKIALLGSIPKGDEARKGYVDWRKDYEKRIIKEIPNVSFLYGDLINDNVGPELVVGHDLWLIKHADIVIVNAPTKIGAGTAQEIVVAKAFQKPVISIIPKDSHHRRSNIVFGGVLIKDWIHPFLFISSDKVAENLDEAINWMKSYLQNPKAVKIKDILIFDKSIANFEEKMEDIVKKYKNKGW